MEGDSALSLGRCSLQNHGLYYQTEETPEKIMFNLHVAGLITLED